MHKKYNAIDSLMASSVLSIAFLNFLIVVESFVASNFDITILFAGTYIFLMTWIMIFFPCFVISFVCGAVIHYLASRAKLFKCALYYFCGLVIFSLLTKNISYLEKNSSYYFQYDFFKLYLFSTLWSIVFTGFFLKFHYGSFFRIPTQSPSAIDESHKPSNKTSDTL